MDKYIYNHFDPLTGSVLPNQEWKEPIVWSLSSPGTDYTKAIITDDEAISYEASLYGLREERGLLFSRMMNGKLLVLRKNLKLSGLTDALITEISGYIYQLTNATRIDINQGLWISASRYAELMVIDPVLETIIIDNSLPIDQQGLIDDIKAEIAIIIQELY